MPASRKPSDQRLPRAAAITILAVCLCTIARAACAAGGSSRLAYELTEGLNLNRFLRQDQVAAHLVLRSGREPRVLIAFPAGDSGVGLWFEPVSRAARWRSRAPLHAVHALDDKGRPLNGISAEIAIDARQLEVRQAVLSSVRELRDYQSLGRLDSAVLVAPDTDARTLRWSRERLDGALSYRLELEVRHGRLQAGRIRAGADGRIGLRITALTGEAPLQPLSGSQLLSAQAGPDPGARQALSFLAYHEKLLAGSWRFDTYFGRDTLVSVRLLMPVLSPVAVESGLASVLSRLSALGEVAHEEDIGERAVLDHLRTDGSQSDAPVFDYKMIDGNYLLAPVIAAWLLQDARGRTRAPAFLAAGVEALGEQRGTRGAALLENLRYVLRTAEAFAIEPSPTHLIALKSGLAVGEWRDSDHGLGGGRYPYDVNAVLVPAALEAAAQLQASGLLAPYELPEDGERFARAAQMAATWRRRAPPLFEVTVERDVAARAIENYAATLALPAQRAVGVLSAQGMHFHALALDAAGQPIRVIHSDEGFALLFAQPDATEMERDLATLMMPFPAGLMTDAGMVVANPVFCPTSLQQQFNRNAYHGTVVWSWQQALLAAGLARQLQRADLSQSARARLLEAQRALWAVIRSTRSLRSSELWSWDLVDGRLRAAPFGTSAADADESNAAQLWSTVYLAVRPPESLRSPAAGSESQRR